MHPGRFRDDSHVVLVDEQCLDKESKREGQERVLDGHVAGRDGGEWDKGRPNGTRGERRARGRAKKRNKRMKTDSGDEPM